MGGAPYVQYVFNEAPQASNPSRRSERHNAAASHVQSSSFKTREISTPFAHELSAFSLALHFETSRQRRIVVLHQLAPRWFRPPPAVPPERLFLLR